MLLCLTEQDFVAECELAHQIKQSTPRGSGAAAVRNAASRREQCELFDRLVQEDAASMYERLLAIK